MVLLYAIVSRREQRKERCIIISAKEYIRFDLIEKKPKTDVYSVVSISGEYPLGTIKWYPNWRGYCFFTLDKFPIILSDDCLTQINDFIKKLKKEHEKKRLEAKNKLQKEVKK